MGVNVYFENTLLTDINGDNLLQVKCEISQKYGVPIGDLYVTSGGKRVTEDVCLKSLENVRISTRLVGGKGGFGSMLRAIGAQIEKTTNREACRDLSGRRLRDINEEKRLRKWLEGQEEREREALERKQKKLERLIAEPKIDVKINPEYEKERRDLPERVSAAVDAGWENATTSENSLKRKAEDEKSKAKKKKLWIDADLSDCSSLSDDEDEDDEKAKSPEQSVTTDSGNESDKTTEVVKA